MLYNADTYPYDELRDLPAARRGAGRSRSSALWYADVIATFDIETTNLDEVKQSIMWHWQCCVGGKVIVGRTWIEYETFLDRIDAVLPRGLCLVFWVHNLAFEFQFLRAIHVFDQKPPRKELPDETFCVTGREVVRANIGKRFEYRCSYFLTNMSLREFLVKMGVPDKKTEMDYSLRRWPWTPVTPEEQQYCVNDVLGLYEAISILFAHDGHNNATCPISSTGYVRADFKKAMRASNDGMQIVRRCSPSYNVYLYIRRAFRGGNTHANRCYTGMILNNIHSADRASSYPDVLVNCLYPVQPFYRDLRVKHLSDLWDRTPYLIYVEFEDIDLQDPFNGCPYLPVHKCQILRDPIIDNGRVIKASALSIYITDVDYMVIKNMYHWRSDRILGCYRSEYGRLPSAMIDVTMDYYRKKTKLKGVKGQEIYYIKAKNKLNSIFGMAATNPVRTTLKFDGLGFMPEEQNEEVMLHKANQRAFCVYAWGCWCT